MDDWEKEFDKQFEQATDNGFGPLWLFKVYPPDNVFPSGIMTIATPQHIKDFIKNHVIKNRIYET